MIADHYTDIGALFTKARLAMNVSLREASQALHIRARYLEALERGNLVDLPGSAYTKGYVQAYAVYLQLDKDEILRRFENIESTLPNRGFYFPVVFSKDKRPARGAIWGGLAAAFVVYVVWVSLFKPATVELTMIEAPPPPEAVDDPAPLALLGVNFVDAACISGEERLYPPCYRPAEVMSVDSSLLPQARSLHTIMELATPQ